MISLLAGGLGLLGAMVAHDLAAQSLGDAALRPFSGTCPRCGTPRSWTAVRCPTCSRPVSREIPLASAGAVVAIGFVNTLGVSWSLLPYLGFLILTLALLLTDLDSLRIVDRLNVRGTALLVVGLGVASLLDQSLMSWGRGLLAALAYFAGTNLVYLVVRGVGFGYGDVKLSVQLGLFTGYLSWGTLGWSVLITALVGGVVSLMVIGAGLLERSRAEPVDKGAIGDLMHTELPYGPAMILGSWLAIILAGLGAFPIPS